MIKVGVESPGGGKKRGGSALVSLMAPQSDRCQERGKKNENLERKKGGARFPLYMYPR